MEAEQNIDSGQVWKISTKTHQKNRQFAVYVLSKVYYPLGFLERSFVMVRFIDQIGMEW
ncbi:hypothetical protein HanHA300_Chr03g0084751 [Helianthus annuus]|nr:hypothetical protein HanHA300_Chr03g0084751 [Helianthus annuus]KAJ0607393.1 hypothetical protein HanHA89_Chr03g0096261 [Helianthus annuus]KAJ0767449.1 hypothetical protein HanLR1_Chr03g0089531 [Helianthus annuus]KAJ0773283.1 hypothetical protein HanOQP8_Chr03g0097491 [Helianthus annuus]